MVKQLSRLLGIAAVCAVASLTASAADLGRNLAGETCQSSGVAAPDQPISVKCGTSDEAVGTIGIVPRVTVAPSDPAEQRKSIASLIGVAGTQATCAEPEWVGNTLLRVCTLNSNGWPRVILGVEAGGKLYRAEGVPSATPALMAAISADAHVSAGDSSALTQALSAKLPAGIVHAAGTDYDGYKQAIETSRLAGAADNYAAAETGYRNAVSVEERLFGRSSLVVGMSLAELALQVSNQGRFSEAAALFHRAGPIIEASSDNGARARYDSYLALDAANQRHYPDALAFARQAVAERRSEVAAAQAAAPTGSEQTAAAPVSQGELAHALRIEAEMAVRLGDYGTAQAAAEESLWIVSDEPGLPLWWRADTLALMGEINEKQSRVIAAEHDLRDARELNQKLFGDTAPTAQADLTLGAFYTRQQVYPPAVDAFRAAYAIAAKDPIARENILPDDEVQFITANMATGTPADQATREAEVFTASQYAASSMADQTIARVAAREAAGNSALASLVAQADQAARERNMVHVQLAAEFAKADSERNSDLEQNLSQQVKLASANADELAAKVRQNYPQYADLTDPGPASLSAVQSQLSSDEALISFIIGDNSSYALVIRHGSFAAVPLDIGADTLAGDVSDLRSAFVPALGRLPEFSLKNSYALYQSLFQPIEAKLDGVHHLIVVPTAALSSLPLALLVSQPPATEHDYSHAAWLIRRYAISEMPSPRALVSLHSEAANHAPAPRAFLGLGDPEFKGAGGIAGVKALADLTGACRQAGPAPADLLRALPPLPGTGAEVQTVASRIGGSSDTVLLGGQATEANLRAQALDQYAVVYFATHGILPGEMHCEGEPALALSPPASTASSTNSDGILAASEIAQLHLNADLVVLSACNTASSSDGMGGGALEGLSDAFFAAGARAVLASHWEVPSSATVTLMTGVFDRSNRARGLAEALRQSQLALIENDSTAHPFNWAAFTLIGDGETFSASQRSASLIK